MPKENTHLYFAQKLVGQLHIADAVDLINRNLKYYSFGSVAPDTFYYSTHKKINAISENLHGKNGNLTNETVFELLDRAKKQNDEADLAFVLGYLTHCALDIVFHPVIYYLSGNYYDRDPKKAEEAVYLHRHLETFLDAKVNKTFYFSDMIKCSDLEPLDYFRFLAKKFKIPQEKLIATLNRKAFVFKFLKSKLAFKLLYLLYGMGIVKQKMLIGIFYDNLFRDTRAIPEIIDYRDIITGEEKKTSIDELFRQSSVFAREMLLIAFDYYHNRKSFDQLKQVIRGESLNTGKVNCTVDQIRYYQH